MGRAQKQKAKAVENRPPAAERKTEGAALPLGPAAVLLAVLAVVAYSNSFDAALTMDSPTLVERDTRLQEASDESLHLIWTKNYWWPSRPSNLFRPLTTLSFLFNYSVLGNGPRPGGYHAVNFLLHAINAALAFAVARRVTGRALVAFMAAAVFALHPMATEAVTNVAGRADLLATVAVLGGLLLHMEGRRRANPWPWRLGVTTVALSGVFAKESAVVLIPVIVLYDFFFPPAAEAGRNRLSRWLDLIPTYALLSVVLVVLFAVRRSVLADMAYYRDHFMDNPLFGLSFLPARLTALKVMGLQLAKLVWPAALSCDYSYDQVQLFGQGSAFEDAKAIVSALVVTGLLAVAWLWRHRAPALAFFIAFYFATLLPTSNLLLRIGSIMAERFVYLPSVGFAAAVAIGVDAAVQRWASSAATGRREAIALGVTFALGLAGAARTYVRNQDWRNEETLFEAARRTSPRSYKAHKGVANAILAGKAPGGERLDVAIAAAEAGLAVIDRRPLPPVDQPSDLMAALGLAYILKGDSLGGGKMGEPAPPAAAVWYRKATVVLERAVETDRAVNERVKQLKRDAGAPPEEVRDVGLRRVHGTLGNAYMRLGEYDKALETFVHLRRLDPMRADGYTQSAWALFSAGRLDEAAVLLIEATFLQKESGAGSLLGDVYRKMGIPPAAEGSLDLAVPRVKEHVAKACAETVRLYREAGREEAYDLRQTCVSRYGIPAEPLDRALAGR